MKKLLPVITVFAILALANCGKQPSTPEVDTHKHDVHEHAGYVNERMKEFDTDDEAEGYVCER